MDSNQRSETRQIYSLLPLATREPHHCDKRYYTASNSRCQHFLSTFFASLKIKTPQVLRRNNQWSWREESNPQPADYKSAALPIELRQRDYLSSITYKTFFVNDFLLHYISINFLHIKIPVTDSSQTNTIIRKSRQAIFMQELQEPQHGPVRNYKGSYKTNT